MTTPSRVWRRIGRRFGITHRGAFLIVFGGAIYFPLGLAIAVGAGTPNPLLYHTQLPEVFRVMLWCGTGAAAVALARHSRFQYVGFLALALAPVERLTSYLGGAAAILIPGGPPGNLGAYLTQVVLYAGVLFVTRLCASWEDPPGEARPRG